MKWLLLAIVMCGCKIMQPPVYLHQTEATYCGYSKEDNLYVMKFSVKAFVHHQRFDTLFIEQRIKPRFKDNTVVILKWNECDQSLVNIKIFKSR